MSKLAKWFGIGFIGISSVIGTVYWRYGSVLEDRDNKGYRTQSKEDEKNWIYPDKTEHYDDPSNFETPEGVYGVFIESQNRGEYDVTIKTLNPDFVRSLERDTDTPQDFISGRKYSELSKRLEFLRLVETEEADRGGHLSGREIFLLRERGVRDLRPYDVSPSFHNKYLEWLKNAENTYYNIRGKLPESEMDRLIEKELELMRQMNEFPDEEDKMMGIDTKIGKWITQKEERDEEIFRLENGIELLEGLMKSIKLPDTVERYRILEKSYLDSNHPTFGHFSGFIKCVILSVELECEDIDRVKKQQLIIERGGKWFVCDDAE